MSFFDLLIGAFKSIARNKSRSALTMLGIVIGIAAVILMLSIGKGAESLILSQVAEFGSDFVYVEPGAGNADEGGTPTPFVDQTLTYDDVKDVRKSIHFTEVGAFLYSQVSAEYGNEEKSVQIVGTTPENISIFPADIASGRFIDESDVQSKSKVVVLGKNVKENLFGDQDPVGSKIKMKNTRFRVVGYLEEQGTRFFQNLDNQIYVPVTTGQQVLGLDYISFMVARTPLPLEWAKDEIRLILRDTHNIDNPEGDLAKDDFFVSTQEDAVEIVGTISAVLTMLLSAIAAISLVVGGIGIMNIMLVSVSERTREIGLRKSVGATRGDILRQFLTEAVILTMVGGMFGVIFGLLTSFGAALLVSYFQEGWDFVIPFDAVIYAFVVAVVVGLVFGIYPARRAAKLNPIDALRYE